MMRYKQLLLLVIFSSKIQSLRFKGTPTSDYIGKWGFYALCDHGYDPLKNPRAYALSLHSPTTFNPEDVVAGSCIFIRGRSIPEFFQKIAPAIKVPYSIISHGEYQDAFLSSYRGYLDDPLIIAWFGTHPCEGTHPKFHPIPLGIHTRHARKSLPFDYLRSQEKTQLLYANFSVKTHPERAPLLKRMKKTSFCYCPEKADYRTYLSQMATCKFTLSPRGLGLDCYRTWEALLVGSIPIVKTSYFDSMYEGLPVLIIDDWACITEEFLHEQYSKITAKSYRLDKLYMDYWASFITTTRSHLPIGDTEKSRSVKLRKE